MYPQAGTEVWAKGFKMEFTAAQKTILAKSGSDLSVWGTEGADSSCAPTGAHRQCCIFWLLFTHIKCWHQPFKPPYTPSSIRYLIIWYQISGTEKLTGVSARLHERQKPVPEIQRIFLPVPVFLVSLLKIGKSSRIRTRTTSAPTGLSHNIFISENKSPP